MAARYVKKLRKMLGSVGFRKEVVEACLTLCYGPTIMGSEYDWCYWKEEVQLPTSSPTEGRLFSLASTLCGARQSAD